MIPDQRGARNPLLKEIHHNPMRVLLSYVLGPTPMDLRFWPGAVAMIFIATLAASLVTISGRSAWFGGALVLMMYLIFAMVLYLLPPPAK